MASQSQKDKTRRTEGVLTSGRSARVVQAVLRATAEELSRVGYAALRVEDVAERSGVNKTTIYRRWPGKAELVSATLSAIKSAADVDTGNVREDLLAMIREVVAFAVSPLGRGLLRILQTERADPEVEKIARALRVSRRAARAQLIERAMARGELPAVVPASIVAELVFSAVHTRILSFGDRVDDAFASEIVDTVLAGVRARARQTDR